MIKNQLRIVIKDVLHVGFEPIQKHVIDNYCLAHHGREVFWRLK